jgi:hypothetical protein
MAVSVPASAAEPAPGDVAPARLYAVGTLAPSRYTVIDRLWVARWRTAFDVPTQPDAAGAANELLAEATRVGGDGVVNLHCLAREPGAAYYCYGNVIKLK